MLRRVFLVLAGLTVGITCISSPVKADAVSGNLFYTVFSGTDRVFTEPFSYDGVSTFTLGAPTTLASRIGADGLLFAPDGNLLVAGQGHPLIEVKPTGGVVNAVDAGAGAFHLALSSTAPDALVYSMCNGGCGTQAIAATTLSGGGLSAGGVAYTVSGDDLDIRGIAFNGTTWFYGTAGDGSTSGNFGTIVFDDTLHTAVTTRLKTDLPAHGLTFDPFSGDIIVSSGDMVDQLDAGGNVLSSITTPGQFDQSAVDGKGHLFVASNSGDLLFVDYNSSGLIGDSGNFSAKPFLASFLDDIAPLSGLGGGGEPSVPEPGSWALLGTALALVGGIVRRRTRWL